MTRDRRVQLVTIGILVLGAALAAIALYRDSQQGLRGIVYVEVDPGIPLTFDAEWLEFGHDSWTTHGVTISIASDDFAQTVELYDQYAIDGSTLQPAPSATEHEHRLTDETPDVAFEVLVPQLDAGTHRASLTVPVHVAAAEGLEDLYEPRDELAVLTIVYDVFRASPKAFYCLQADRVLSDSRFFDPDFFVEAAADVLSAEDLARVEDAAQEFNAAPGDDLDPGPFFDAIEDVCGVAHRDRWVTFVN